MPDLHACPTCGHPITTPKRRPTPVNPDRRPLMERLTTRYREELDDGATVEQLAAKHRMPLNVVHRILGQQS